MSGNCFRDPVNPVSRAQPGATDLCAVTEAGAWSRSAPSDTAGKTVKVNYAPGAYQMSGVPWKSDPRGRFCFQVVNRSALSRIWYAERGPFRLAAILWKDDPRETAAKGSITSDWASRAPAAP